MATKGKMTDSQKAWDDIVPTLREVDRRWLFGMVTFRCVTEDRRPDLTQEQAQAGLGYKYKTLVMARVFFWKFSLIVRSLNPGSIYICDEEIPAARKIG